MCLERMCVRVTDPQVETLSLRMHEFRFSELHDGFKLDALLMAPAQEQFQTLHI